MVSRRNQFVLVLLLCAAFAGCAVDDRTLLESDASTGSAGAGGDGGAGSLGAGGVDDDAGPPPHCSYPADDGKSECQTLVDNPGFHADVSHWQNEYDAIFLRWDAGDASLSEDSGSSTINNTLFGLADGTASAGARQCLPANGLTRYQVGADVLIESGLDQFAADAEPPMNKAQAGISLLFFELPDCQGQSLAENLTSTLVEQTDAWQPVFGSRVAPKETVSMAVRLVAMKPFRQFSMKAHFDNVLVRAH